MSIMAFKTCKFLFVLYVIIWTGWNFTSYYLEGCRKCIKYNKKKTILNKAY